MKANYTYLVLLFIVLMVLSTGLSAQSKFNKWNRNHYKSRYSASIMSPKRKCNTINKKRNKKPRKPLFAANTKVKTNKKAESNYTPKPNNTPKPTPQPKPQPKPEPKPEPVAVDEKFQIEDDVLSKYSLPKPTSAMHDQVRNEVEEQLKTIEIDKPLKLEPLFFTFDEDEFAFVDMEPFLRAVEYALQGRMILIEGHTDAKGQDEYNVSLSMKRVQKIRTLMVDMGVPDSNISVVGYGEEHATTGDDGQDDRRVDFTVF